MNVAVCANAQCTLQSCTGDLTRSNGNHQQFLKQRFTGGSRLEFVRTENQLHNVTDLKQFGSVELSNVGSITFLSGPENHDGIVTRRGTITMKNRTVRSDVFIVLGMKGHPKFTSSRSYVLDPHNEELKLEDDSIKAVTFGK